MSRIQIRNKQRRYKIDNVSANAFCSSVLHAIGESDSILSLVFVNSKEMQEINRRYLERNYATDVLSFAYTDEVIDGSTFLGEIVIAPEVVIVNAKRYHVHPDKEFKKLIVHGVLHLIGHDHENDNGRMNRLQANLIRRGFFKNASPILVGMKDTI